MIRLEGRRDYIWSLALHDVKQVQTRVSNLRKKVIGGNGDNENLMRGEKRKGKAVFGSFFPPTSDAIAAQTTTWWPLAVNNKADKDSPVPNKWNNIKIAQSLCHQSPCGRPVQHLHAVSGVGYGCLSASCGIQMLGIETRIFLSKHKPILSVNLH